MTDEKTKSFQDPIFQENQPPPEGKRPSSGWMISLIMVAVLIWGSIHALGAGLQRPERAVAVIVFTLAFLGFWLLLLRSRDRKENRRQNES
ncbi:MAG: hypothetical protein N2C14_30960 [Planctomycetales bacterium]